MVKLIFPLFVMIHGLVHMMGFSKAYGYRKEIPLSGVISKPVGLIWAAVSTAIIIVAMLILFQKSWWLMGIISVLLSQSLILFYWKDAKYGTIVNIVILLAAIVNFSEWNFSKAGKNTASELLTNQASPVENVTQEKIAHLPPIVQKWMHRSGAINNPIAFSVRLKQQGMLRTKPDGNWMQMTAEQYFTVVNPAFVWNARISAGIIHIAGRDVYLNGKGHMLIKAASVITVADARGKETDQGTMLRYLAEIQWFPSAAISPWIRWEQLNDSSARATMTYGDMSVSGNFSFNANGDITKFEAQRYMEQKGKYSLETWVVPVTDWGVFHGIRIPIKGRAIWKLKAGDFDWFQWEISQIEYNCKTTY